MCGDLFRVMVIKREYAFSIFMWSRSCPLSYMQSLNLVKIALLQLRVVLLFIRGSQ